MGLMERRNQKMTTKKCISRNLKLSNMTQEFAFPTIFLNILFSVSGFVHTNETVL